MIKTSSVSFLKIEKLFWTLGMRYNRSRIIKNHLKLKKVYHLMSGYIIKTISCCLNSDMQIDDRK